MRQLLCACLCATLLGAPATRADSPSSSPRLTADIAPQSLAAALSAFAEQTGLQLVYVSEIVEGQRSRGARAGLTLSDALTQLLDNTGLQFEFLNQRAVGIFAARPRPMSPDRGDETSPPTSALLDQIQVTVVRGVQQADKVPIDVVAWTQDAMQASGVKGLAEIGALTPGVEFDFFSTVGSGVYTNVAIRGVTDRHGSATGIFFDETPLPPARSNTFGRALPSYFDLDRIEVLRGPQGVLLGPDTQGGAIKFISNQPSVTTVTALAHGEWATTARGDPSYEAGGAAGGPIVQDLLGFRLSGWYRTDGGYVDRVDPFTGATVDANSNLLTSKSVRGALTFTPTESLTVNPSLRYESSAARDSPAFYTYLSNPSAGELANGSLIEQPFDDEFYLASLRLTANLGATEFRAVSAYFHRSGNLVADDTESIKWGGWGDPRGPAYPVSYSNAVTTRVGLSQRVLSQDLRLASDPDGPISWVAGVWYSRENGIETDRVAAGFIPVLTGPLDASNATTMVQTQHAAMGQLTSRVARDLTLSAGLRVERDDSDAVSSAPPVFRGRAAATLVAPKFALSYELDEHQLYYFSAAKGYAPAGFDSALPTCFENPTPYPTDTLWSYELGTKQGLLGGRAHLDAGLFHIRWNNGAVATGNCLFAHLPGIAVSNGFDLAMRALLSERVRVDLSVAYTSARYAETVDAGGKPIVRDGDALGTPPLVTSPWNATTSIEERFSLRNRVIVTLRAEDVFHSRNPGPFYTNDPQSPYYAPGLLSDPATNVLNLRAVFRRANFDVAVFVNNALDSQPTLLKRNKGDDDNTLFYATTFRPRTVGLSGSWHY
jgi:iron complex outermembrane recepter protein